jgi:hypothetical protein
VPARLARALRSAARILRETPPTLYGRALSGRENALVEVIDVRVRALAREEIAAALELVAAENEAPASALRPDPARYTPTETISRANPGARP